MVNVRGQQVSAANLEELRRLAKKGELGAGDIVQPPGASDWLYALEVPELKTAFPDHALEPLDMPTEARTLPTGVKVAAAIGLSIVAIGTWSYALNLAASEPAIEDLELIGEKGMNYGQVLVTAEGASLHAEASESSADVAPLPKNAKVDLLGKRGRWYRLRLDGKEGYAKVDDVVPAYFFADERTKLEHDPLYNPDKYVYVANSSWMQPADADSDRVTQFEFMLQNDSKFEMTDIKIVAAIKDHRGAVLEQQEIPVVGAMPPNQGVMVGTLLPDRKDKTGTPQVILSSEYEKLLQTDPTLAERWADGVEVRLASTGFQEANVTLVEVRAVPPAGG
jgi:hypothetical protein